jgi:protein-export membrane protein SecD
MLRFLGTKGEYRKRGNVNRSTRIRAVLSVIVIALSLWFLWPTYRLSTMSKEEENRLEIEDPERIDKLHKKALKLGLDLKGGMHLVLEVDDSQLKGEEKKDILDRALEIVRNRIDQFGVSEPTIQKEGSKRIIVQLPGLQDPERAKRLLGQTAMLEWRLIRRQQEVADVLRKLDDTFKRVSGDSLVEISPIRGETLGVVPDTASAARKEPKGAGQELPKLSPFGEEAPGESLFAGTKGAGEAPLNVPLETVDKGKPFTSLLQSFYRDWIVVPENNVPLVRRMLARPEAQTALPKDSEFMWFDDWMNFPEGGRGKALMLVAKDEYVSGANLVSADPTSNPQAPTQLSVSFTFNRKGARDLARFTGENVGRFTAIILDGKIKSFPVIKSKIPDGRGIIEGNFTDVEARDLAIILRAGALPAPMFTREERTVGPSLGSDSIRQGLRAGLIGGGAVLVFIIIYYQLSGVIAALGVTTAMVTIFGFLAYFGAALTLPGIAGLVLTIGMAVDANVLIYERIREEIRREKTIRAAVDAGYSRAFVTILDSNLTTLISAVALWQFGTGPIKGFATTLSIGILASMFAACVFCRFIFDLWVARPMKRLSI